LAAVRSTSGASSSRESSTPAWVSSRGLLQRDQEVRRDRGGRVVGRAGGVLDREGLHAEPLGELRREAGSGGRGAADGGGSSRQVGLGVGDGLERMQREGLGSGGGCRLERAHRSGAAHVTDEDRDAVLEERLARGFDLVVGDAEENRMRALGGDGDLAAACDADLDPRSMRGAREGAARPTVADDREHEPLRVGSLF
jgi:hypothetical protein